jgi:hypothetical protein
MPVNDKVVVVSGDVQYGQLAPSQENRINFTPGKVTARPDDMNWPKDYRIPTGTPAFDGESAGPVNMARSRTVKLGRGIIGDQEITAPIAHANKTTTITDPTRWGVVTPVSVLTPTDTQNVNGGSEKQVGNDNIAGA